MNYWLGRVDSVDDAEAFRLHQVVRAVEPDSAAGISLIGFACDEGVRRNGGRQGAVEGPSALRRALSNLPVTGNLPIYDAGDVSCADTYLENSQIGFARKNTALLAAGHFTIGMGGAPERAYDIYLGLVHSDIHSGTPILFVNLADP